MLRNAKNIVIINIIYLFMQIIGGQASVLAISPKTPAPPPPGKDEIMLGGKPAKITKRTKEETTADGKKITIKTIDTIEPDADSPEAPADAYPKDIVIGEKTKFKYKMKFKFNVKTPAEEKEIRMAEAEAACISQVKTDCKTKTETDCKTKTETDCKSKAENECEAKAKLNDEIPGEATNKPKVEAQIDELIQVTDRLRIKRNYFGCLSVGVCLGSLQLSSYAFFDVNYQKNDNDLAVKNPISFDVNFVNLDWLWNKSLNYGIGLGGGTGITGGVNFFGGKLGFILQTDFARLELGYMVLGPTFNDGTSFNNGIYFGVGAPLIRYVSEIKDLIAKK